MLTDLVIVDGLIYCDKPLAANACTKPSCRKDRSWQVYEYESKYIILKAKACDKLSKPQVLLITMRSAFAIL